MVALLLCILKFSIFNISASKSFDQSTMMVMLISWFDLFCFLQAFNAKKTCDECGFIFIKKKSSKGKKMICDNCGYIFIKKGSKGKKMINTRSATM